MNAGCWIQCLNVCDEIKKSHIQLIILLYAGLKPKLCLNLKKMERKQESNLSTNWVNKFNKQVEKMNVPDSVKNNVMIPPVKAKWFTNYDDSYTVEMRREDEKKKERKRKKRAAKHNIKTNAQKINEFKAKIVG